MEATNAIFVHVFVPLPRHPARVQSPHDTYLPPPAADGAAGSSKAFDGWSYFFEPLEGTRAVAGAQLNSTAGGFELVQLSCTAAARAWEQARTSALSQRLCRAAARTRAVYMDMT